MGLTLEDLERMDVSRREVTATVGGIDVVVRGVATVEEDEIDALFPMPLAPRVKDAETGKFVRDETADGYEEKCDEVHASRRALRAAVALGLEIGGKRWTRVDLSGSGRLRLSPEARKSGTAAHDRMVYAREAAPKIRETLGYAAILEVLSASVKAETGAGDGPGDAGGKSTPPTGG